MGINFEYRGHDPKSYDHALEQKISDALTEKSRAERLFDDRQLNPAGTTGATFTRRTNARRAAYNALLNAHGRLMQLYQEKFDWWNAMHHGQQFARIAEALAKDTAQPNHGCKSHPVYMGHRSGGCVACNPERMSD